MDTPYTLYATYLDGAYYGSYDDLTSAILDYYHHLSQGAYYASIAWGDSILLTTHVGRMRGACGEHADDAGTGPGEV